MKVYKHNAYSFRNILFPHSFRTVMQYVTSDFFLFSFLFFLKISPMYMRRNVFNPITKILLQGGEATAAKLIYEITSICFNLFLKHSIKSLFKENPELHRHRLRHRHRHKQTDRHSDTRRHTHRDTHPQFRFGCKLKQYPS